MGRKFSLSIFIFVVLLGVLTAEGEFHCHDVLKNSENEYSKTVCYVKECGRKIQNHIREELFASLNYLYTAAYFDQEVVNRPGLAKFMYESASEERQHAIMMLNYLNKRGIPNLENFELKTEPQAPGDMTYKAALTTALNLEIDVANSIHKLIRHCESDFHAADYFTEPIMAEQHEGIRRLQGMLKEFDNLALDTTDAHQLAFAEYLFDLKLLKGEV